MRMTANNIDVNILDDLTKINNMISMANTMIVNLSKKEQYYNQILSIAFHSYKRHSRSYLILSKLHDIGKRKRLLFGCRIPFRDGNYWIDCPVKLSHLPLPLGASIGAATSKICSICGEEPLDCNHVKGKTYNHVKCITLKDGYCNICIGKKCEHVVGQFYDGVQALNVVVNIKFDHIALVTNPLEVDAGITSIAIDRKDLIKQMQTDNPNFRWGTPLNCNHCLSCKG